MALAYHLTKVAPRSGRRVPKQIPEVQGQRRIRSAVRLGGRAKSVDKSVDAANKSVCATGCPFETIWSFTRPVFAGGDAVFLDAGFRHHIRDRAREERSAGKAHPANRIDRKKAFRRSFVK